MPHTGLEPKPPWSAVPRAVRESVEDALGAQVRRATRVWGGYAPTPTYRLRLKDGRRAFFKGVGPFSSEFSWTANLHEEQAYRELSGVIGHWLPVFHGAFQCDGWHVMLLEDLGPKCVPPWTRSMTRRVTHAYAEFHLTTLGAELPQWLRRPHQQFADQSRQWSWVVDEDVLRPVAALVGDFAGDALKWLRASVPVLTEVSCQLAEAPPPHALLHRDTRSDNLRWVDGRLRLFDWPHLGVGPVEYDAAGFAQSVAVEGGPAPEEVMAWYAERCPVRPDVLDAAVSDLAGYFAGQAWRPEVPELPRLRTFQRRQFSVTITWAARRMGLPEPSWVAGVEA
ncbi:MAG: phosphotransferase [Dehalococcoidia bacterium]